MVSPAVFTFTTDWRCFHSTVNAPINCSDFSAVPEPLFFFHLSIIKLSARMAMLELLIEPQASNTCCVTRQPGETNWWKTPEIFYVFFYDFFLCSTEEIFPWSGDWFSYISEIFGIRSVKDLTTARVDCFALKECITSAWRLSGSAAAWITKLCSQLIFVQALLSL